MPKLFEPFQYGGLALKNRVVMSPMCQYSVWAEDGVLNEWHWVHYLSRAVGGVGLIIIEMTGVVPDGRITVHDLGLWNAEQAEALARLVREIHRYGAKVGIQIAHAGRKTESPSLRPVAPSPIPFSERYRVPHALSVAEIAEIVAAFGRAARLAVEAGVDLVELHGAHGYLIHQFFSPLSNHREDAYREPTRFASEVIRAVRRELPDRVPLAIRVSATEWDPAGYNLEAFLPWARALRDAGAELFDVSSGGNSPVRVTPTPGYQVPFAAEIRRQLRVPVIAVGALDSYPLAEAVLNREDADLVAIGRGLLANPYWANAAAQALGGRVQVPKQYWRAFPPEFLAAPQA
ncbi:MAG: NADH:flavin oxidoreductase/NADH oxidase [Firmicutes bacterium]|nr:NADH:flavin oxidoreductase/NADH oxidase [Alicyclobacillaceae bacterium]MCL6496163.1 NADH:flavin oxidoreductase/NADH oxidase [Bacillota bacterium]